MFVKICGITTEEDALLATALGADAVGFVFAPSTRQVTVAQARDIARRLPPEVLTVGVFRDELPQRVIDVVFEAGLRAAQLHGHEPPETTRAVRRGVPYVIQAFAAGSSALDRAGEHRADVILVDSAQPGSGTVFDWTLIDGVPPGSRVLLAGGLGPENVEVAIRRVRPWGVDVSSGVEASPGRKDPMKLKRFIDAAKAVEPGDDGAPASGTFSDGPYDWQEDG
jgi:phosphoribosylanthranilate isomerase